MEIEALKSLMSEASTVAVLLWFLYTDRKRHEMEISYYRELFRQEMRELKILHER